ncbi:MAG TPA: TetR-like C-terminal domain-containing protein [Ilumatobacteraceae bacterium]|nr:TetR-like C-terminal domain-containing protein [Ilumatobacteraceae bacterium]
MVRPFVVDGRLSISYSLSHNANRVFRRSGRPAHRADGRRFPRVRHADRRCARNGPPDDLAARVEAAAVAYRRFAAADPQRFSLLFGLPAPGFVPHADGAAVHANVTAMTHLEQLVRSVIDHGVPPSPLVREVGPALASEVPNKQAPDGARIPANTYQALLHTLAAIHGFACLETFGHLEWISEQARDELFQAQIRLLAQVMGGPSAAEQPPSSPAALLEARNYTRCG